MVDLNEESINLRALKQNDDSIVEICVSAGQVAIYIFNQDKTCWERKNIEGPMFFVRRLIYPEYAFVIINRLSTTNFVQTITEDFECKDNTPYLLYKNDQQEIYCIWFYQKENCLLIHDKIETILQHKQNNQSISNENEQRLSPSKTLSNALLNGISQNNKTSELIKKMLCLDMNDEMVNPITPATPKVKLVENKINPENFPEMKSGYFDTFFEKNSGNFPVMEGNAFGSSDTFFEKNAEKPNRSLNLNALFKSQLANRPRNDVATAALDESAPVILPSIKGFANSPQRNSIERLVNNVKKNDLSEILTAEKLEESIPEIHQKETTFNEHMIPDIKPQISDHSNHPGLSLLNFPAHKHKMFPTPLATSPSVKPITENPLYLSMEQLKKTMIFLLKNDADFLHTIHTAYVENIKQCQIKK